MTSSENPGHETPDELSAYLAPAYPDDGAAFAFSEEPQVPYWRRYAEHAREAGPARALALRFPQIGFPVETGMSGSAEYRRATRQGEAEASRRERPLVEREDRLVLAVEETFAGAVPVLVARHRPDFVFLVRALTARNEPEVVPDSMGACLVKGLVNWERVADYRRAWEATRGELESTPEAWATEMATGLKERKELWQDRLILLSDGPYSAVPATELGLDEAAWRERSLAIRRAHECFHYLTLRRFGRIRSHLLDELLADYAGLTASFGRYDPELAMRLLGLDGESPRPGGRWTIYRGTLSESAWGAVVTLVRRAAEALELRTAPDPASPAEARRVLLELAALGLDGIAALRASPA